MSVETKILADNMRFYADVRFKQMTLLLSAMTVAAAAIGVPDRVLVMTPRVTVGTAVPVMAMFVVAILWVMEVRAAAYFTRHSEVVPEAWPSPKPTRLFWWLNATNASLALQAGLFGGWWWLGLRWRLVTLWLVVLAIVFGLLLAFSIVTYWPQWKKHRSRAGGAK